MKNNLHLLLLVKIFPPVHTGGVPNYYSNLISNLKEIKTSIIAKGANSQEEDAFDHKFSSNTRSTIDRSIHFPEHMGLQLSIKYFCMLIQLVRTVITTVKNKKIDIIVIGQVRMFLLLTAYFSSLITCKPFIIFLHGEEIPQISMKSNGILKWLYFRASGYYCNSNFTSNRLKKFMSCNNISPVVITPGVENRFFREPDSGKKILERLNIDKEKVIYTIARLDERKGQDMVIKALPRVIENYPDIVYVIGGKGPTLNKLKNLVDELSLEAYVRFAGFVPDDELVAYHHMGDVFVMPNRILEDGDTEGFGIVFLEANAAGVPVIGGDEGGSVDAIQNGVTGFCVNAKSEVAIADCICKLMSDQRLRKKMGKAGRERALKKFKWGDLSEKFEKSISDFIDETGR